MPATAVIGGTVVNMRLSTVDRGHRATLDIDVVAHQGTPTAVEILARSHDLARTSTVIVNGIEEDVIETRPAHSEDLDELDKTRQDLFRSWPPLGPRNRRAGTHLTPSVPTGRQ